MDRTKQPIVVDLAPSADRTCIVLILRAEQPIGIQQVVYTLKQFAEQLQAKFPASSLELPDKKIIV